ncbi:MAG: glycosyltransferase [Patescibacteria group bacterium]
MGEDKILKVALVHDFLIQDGGAERVLACFQRMFPSAPTYVLIHDKSRMHPPFKSTEIRSSFLNSLPQAVNRYQWYVPLMPMAVEQMDFSGFDLVISSSSLFVKGIIVPPGTTHVCYCHTPTRFLWQERFGYVHEDAPPWIMRAAISILVHRLRPWDRMAADRPHAMVTNSRVSQERIRHFYKRESTVIHPPVDVERVTVSNTPGSFFLTGGRLVGYKRFDLVVHGFRALNLPLKIFGVGSELARLKKIAGPKTEFLGQISDEEKFNLYRNAIAFIQPQLEDFGITAIEAMAAGKPVISYGKGGAEETVIPGKSGLHMNEQSPKAVIQAVRSFKPEMFDPLVIREHAEKFSNTRFEKEFSEFLNKLLNVPS